MPDVNVVKFGKVLDRVHLGVVVVVGRGGISFQLLGDFVDHVQAE